MNMTHDQFVSWLALEGFELKVHRQMGPGNKWRIVPTQYPKRAVKDNPELGYNVSILKLASGRWEYTDDAAPHFYVDSNAKLSAKDIEAFSPYMLEKIRYEP